MTANAVPICASPEAHGDVCGLPSGMPARNTQPQMTISLGGEAAILLRCALAGLTYVAGTAMYLVLNTQYFPF